MVEESLVSTERLSESQRHVGRLLVNMLDKEHIDIIAAFWLLDEEENQWRLCLATRLADSIGPLEVYKTIRRLLHSLPADDRGDLNLSDVAVISPDDLEVANLRHRYGVVDHEDTRRIRRVDGPYVYRLMKA